MKTLIAGLLMISFSGLAMAHKYDRYPICTQQYVCGPVNCSWVTVCK